MTTLDQRRTKRPGNRENIERIKAEMHRDTQLYRLRALREELGVTQVSLAGKLVSAKTEFLKSSTATSRQPGWKRCRNTSKR